MIKEGSPEKRWLVIINPNAGKRKGEKDWPEIFALLTDAGFDFIHEFTTHRDHAMILAEKYIRQGFRKIIVVGGDGTMNEVINGIFLQDRYKTDEIRVGMIMVGTGNDWGKMYHLREDYKEAVRQIKQERTFIQDAGLVTYSDQNGVKKRYFINSGGIGYDALVVKMTNRDKDRGKSGPLSYLLNLVKGLFRYQQTYLGIDLDGTTIYTGRVFSMSVGICKFSGGGMMQLPFAVPDDGLLDMTIYKNVTKKTVIRHMNKLYSGKFTHLPFVQTHQGNTVTVSSTTQDQAFLETDGESLGHSPFHFSIIPKSIKIIVGDIQAEGR